MLLCSIDSLSEPLKNSVLKYLIRRGRCIPPPSHLRTPAALRAGEGAAGGDKRQRQRDRRGGGAVSRLFARDSSRFSSPGLHGHHGRGLGKSGGRRPTATISRRAPPEKPLLLGHRRRHRLVAGKLPRPLWTLPPPATPAGSTTRPPGTEQRKTQPVVSPAQMGRVHLSTQSARCIPPPWGSDIRTGEKSEQAGRLHRIRFMYTGTPHPRPCQDFRRVFQPGPATASGCPGRTRRLPPARRISISPAAGRPSLFPAWVGWSKSRRCGRGLRFQDTAV